MKVLFTRLVVRNLVWQLCVVLVFGFCSELRVNAQEILPAGSNVEGRSIQSWTAEWWNWTNSMPASRSPIGDATGEFANENQASAVFFVAGNTGGSSVRSFSVPANTPILFPLINVAYTRSPEPLDADGNPVWATGNDPTEVAPASEDFVQSVIYDLIDEAVDLPALTFSLDGQTASDLGVDLTGHREQSGPYTAIISSDDTWSGEPMGSWSGSVSDGYWVMLDGLPEGDHTVNFGGTVKPGFFGDEAFVVDVKANITAVPEPTIHLQFAMLLALISTAIVRRRS